ncbi:MAG: CDP-alcohol phosphatidyltransferase family protein [Acidimicrobiia bacterium]|nr:CDP-alcohol phosphatidyltransferase family protein [Acidimicrobiia bacterium]
MFDGHWREAVERAVDPIGASLKRTGITADALTIIGVVVAGTAAVVIGNGYLRIGFVLLLLAGIPDLLDGAVAKASGTTSVRGAFFDSTSDRVTDALLFGGLSWYLASNEPGRISVLPVAVMGAAMLISYQRAKAESLGFDAKGGIMERAERFIVLSIGLIFPEILIPVLWVMLVLTLVTAVQRFVKVWRQASASHPLASARRAERRPRARTRERLEARRARRASLRRRN